MMSWLIREENTLIYDTVKKQKRVSNKNLSPRVLMQLIDWGATEQDFEFWLKIWNNQTKRLKFLE